MSPLLEKTLNGAVAALQELAQTASPVLIARSHALLDYIIVTHGPVFSAISKGSKTIGTQTWRTSCETESEGM
jgi:hypothetical protein